MTFLCWNDNANACLSTITLSVCLVHAAHAIRVLQQRAKLYRFAGADAHADMGAALFYLMQAGLEGNVQSALETAYNTYRQAITAFMRDSDQPDVSCGESLQICGHPRTDGSWTCNTFCGRMECIDPAIHLTLFACLVHVYSCVLVCLHASAPKS